MKRPNILMTVELLAGTSIEDAVREASSIANKLNLAYCVFNFNGVLCYITQNADVDKAVRDYLKALKEDHKSRFA